MQAGMGLASSLRLLCVASLDRNVPLRKKRATGLGSAPCERRLRGGTQRELHGALRTSGTFNTETSVAGTGSITFHA